MPSVHRPKTASRPPRSALARLKLRHLDLFRAVCELQTLRKAADATHMTQPAATKLVREMEEMLGATLFVRDRRGMRLTPHGDVVRRHVGVVMADVRNMAEEVASFTSGEAGHVRLGIIPSLASQLLARSMAQMLEHRPRLRFTLIEAAATELLAHLARNDLDLCFGRVLDARSAADLRVVPVYSESFAIVCSAEHPQARRRAPGWPQLAAQRWVLPVSGTPLRELIDQLFTANGALRPDAAVESSSFEKTRYVIAQTQLYGVLPRSIALQARAAGDLVLVKPTLGPGFAPVSLILRKDVLQSPPVDEFARVVCATAAELRLS